MNQIAKSASQSDARWRTVETRTHDADFVYAVKTTGIYCRSGCASRLPSQGNVRFFDTPANAAHAGFRPCKRCRPDQARFSDPRIAAVA
ncbi:MAG: Ada metal-binding domain-containing protein [Rhodospirillaceae bacterium]